MHIPKIKKTTSEPKKKNQKCQNTEKNASFFKRKPLATTFSISRGL